MLDVVDVRDRIQAQCPLFAQRVDVGMDVDQTRQVAINALTATVMDLSEVAESPVAATGLHLQRLASRVGVLIALPDQRRRDKSNGLRAARAQVRGALLGWVPFEGAAELSYVSGQMSDAKDGVVWWLDVFQTSYHARADYA